FLWLGGWSGRLVLAAGLAGVALSVACALSLIVTPLRAARARLGTITLLVAAAMMGLASAAAGGGRSEADEGAEAAAAELRREKILRDGYTAARVMSLGGLVLGVFPLVAGLGAVMSGRSARGRAPLKQGIGAKRPPLSASRDEAPASGPRGWAPLIAVAL